MKEMIKKTIRNERGGKITKDEKVMEKMIKGRRVMRENKRVIRENDKGTKGWLENGKRMWGKMIKNEVMIGKW